MINSDQLMMICVFYVRPDDISQKIGVVLTHTEMHKTHYRKSEISEPHKIESGTAHSEFLQNLNTPHNNRLYQWHIRVWRNFIGPPQKKPPQLHKIVNILEWSGGGR